MISLSISCERDKDMLGALKSRTKIYVDALIEHLVKHLPLVRPITTKHILHSSLMNLMVDQTKDNKQITTN